MLDPKYVTFIEVVKSGSFTKAADKLCLTQPAVSNQIKAIENEFEVKILGFYLEGLTCREIAETVGKSPKSVDNAVQRIRRKIARQLLSGDISNG